MWLDLWAAWQDNAAPYGSVRRLLRRGYEYYCRRCDAVWREGQPECGCSYPVVCDLLTGVMLDDVKDEPVEKQPRMCSRCKVTPVGGPTQAYCPGCKREYVREYEQKRKARTR